MVLLHVCKCTNTTPYTAVHCPHAKLELLLLQNIQKAQNRYEHKTMVGWSPWRPIVLAVLFGLLMIFAIVAGLTVIWGRFPRTTAAFTLLLWIMTGLFFILGAGTNKRVWSAARHASCRASHFRPGACCLDFHHPHTFHATPGFLHRELFTVCMLLAWGRGNFYDGVKDPLIMQL